MSVVPRLCRSRDSDIDTGSPTLLAESSGSPQRIREVRRTRRTPSCPCAVLGCVGSQEPPRGEGDASSEEHQHDVEQPDYYASGQFEFVAISLRRTRFSDFLRISFAHRRTSDIGSTPSKISFRHARHSSTYSCGRPSKKTHQMRVDELRLGCVCGEHHSTTSISTSFPPNSTSTHPSSSSSSRSSVSIFRTGVLSRYSSTAS